MFSNRIKSCFQRGPSARFHRLPRFREIEGDQPSARSFALVARVEQSAPSFRPIDVNVMASVPKTKAEFFRTASHSAASSDLRQN